MGIAEYGEREIWGRIGNRGLWEIGNREIWEYAIKEKGKGNEVTGHKMIIGIEEYGSEGIIEFRYRGRFCKHRLSLKINFEH